MCEGRGGEGWLLGGDMRLCVSCTAYPAFSVLYLNCQSPVCCIILYMRQCSY